MGPCDFLAEVAKPSVVLAIENTQHLSRCLRARQVQKEIIALTCPETWREHWRGFLYDDLPGPSPGQLIRSPGWIGWELPASLTYLHSGMESVFVLRTAADPISLGVEQQCTRDC